MYLFWEFIQYPVYSNVLNILSVKNQIFNENSNSLCHADDRERSFFIPGIFVHIIDNDKKKLISRKIWYTVVTGLAYLPDLLDQWIW